jgi:MFS family permease
MSNPNKHIIAIVVFTVFLDIVGFSIIFPLFPSLLEHYLSVEGADSVIGKLIAVLSSIAGDDTNAVVTLFGGVLGSIYGALQFVFSTFWGALSDRFGRRKTLIVTLVGTCIANLLWAFSGTFTVLIAARVLGGIMAGNISTASAVIADSTTSENRAMGMGFVGMSIGLGFILGPAIGAGLLQIPLEITYSGAAFALNPFSIAAFGALALNVINLIWALKRLPETLPEEKRSKETSFNPINRFKGLQLPGVFRVNLLYLIFMLGFTAAEFTLTFMASERFGYSEMNLAGLFVYIGLIIALVQGGIVRRVVPKYGERKVAFIGLAITGPGYLFTGAASSTLMLYIGLGCMAVGSALVMPTLSALISRYTSEENQGLALGTFRSMGSLSRSVGPIVGAGLYFLYGSASPYLLSALALVLPLWIVRTLPDPSKQSVSASN